MEHTKVELKLPTELVLPVTAKLEDCYWTIRDQTDYIFMGRKEEKAMKSIVWYLNNCEEIAKCWNAHDLLQAKADCHDELVEACEEALTGYEHICSLCNTELPKPCKCKWQPTKDNLVAILAKAKEL